MTSTMFGWTYNQYLYAAGVLQVLPNELAWSPNAKCALLAIKSMWSGSYIGRGIEPADDCKGIDDQYRKVVNGVWYPALVEI